MATILESLRAAGPVARLAGLLEILEHLATHERDLTPVAHSPMDARDAGKNSMHTPRRIDRVIGWIHRELHREVALAEAAQIARVTPGGFSRYFRKAVGKTFTQYVNDVRCGEACIHLRRSDKAIALIATECGFETMSHFNRQFRLRMGTTPREFRRGVTPPANGRARS